MIGQGMSDSDGGRPSKVARLIDEYDLEGIGADLEDRWTADDGRSSLRDLAEYFNRQLLHNVLAEAGTSTLDGETENLYRLLTAEDVSSAERTRVERRLERQGVDIDDLRSRFVSYQAIRTYLKSTRGVEYERAEGDRLQTVADQVRRLQSRTANVTESKLARLSKTHDLTGGAFQVTVDVRVFCEECGEVLEFDTLLERGHCGCQ